MRIAVIGGSGFAAGFGSSSWETVETPYGQAVMSRTDLENGSELIFLPRHGPGHRTPPHRINHRANISALRASNVDAVLATAAVGSLRVSLAPGQFAVLSDFIDMTRGAVPTFFDEIGTVRHTDFSQPFSPRVREALIKTAAPCEIHREGIYLCLSGPRYETPAEVRLYASWGADMVGMTVAPEAILAREAELEYGCVAVATNYGCGLQGADPLSHTEVELAMAAARESLSAWLLRAALALTPSGAE